jgi:hypothetical protein
METEGKVFEPTESTQYVLPPSQSVVMHAQINVHERRVFNLIHQ